MSSRWLVMYDEEQYRQLVLQAGKLRERSHARAVLVVDRNGQYITGSGQVENLDTTSIASLTAGNFAATNGLARLIGEKGFPSIYHEGQNESLYLSLIADRVILVVMFDKESNLGLVRLRARAVSEAIEKIVCRPLTAAATQRMNSGFSDLADDDIEQLLGQW